MYYDALSIPDEQHTYWLVQPWRDRRAGMDVGERPKDAALKGEGGG